MLSHPRQMHARTPATHSPHSHTRNVQISTVHQELPTHPKLPADATLAPTLAPPVMQVTEGGEVRETQMCSWEDPGASD